MEKFIPYEKLSKKEKKRRNAIRRGSWYGINPVTRKPANSKAYNRRKAGKWYDPTDLLFLFFAFSAVRVFVLLVIPQILQALKSMAGD